MTAIGIPPPLDTDDDDVAWALQTAQVQWKRGAVADAIVWLRRAVDAAIACGRSDRATELNGAASSLTEQMLAHAAAGGGPQPSVADGVDELLGGDAPVPSAGRASIDIEFDEVTEVASESTSVLPENNPFAQPTAAAPWDVPAPPRAPAESITTVMSDPAMALPIDSAHVVSSVGASAQVVHSSELEADPYSAAVVSESELIAEPPLPPDDHVEGPTEISRFPSSLLPPSAGGAEEAAAAEAAPPQEAPAPAEVPAPVATEPEVQAPAESAAVADADDTAASTDAASEPEGEAAALNLEEVAGLEDLPPDAQEHFASRAKIEVLDIDEEVGNFAVALVLDGWVSIMPAIADAACAHAGKGEVVFTTGSLETGVSLRVVAGESDTRVAVWDAEAWQDATGDCPWVADELRIVADRFQALAGATMGPLGDRLDDGLRAEVTKRCEVKLLLPGEVFVEAGSGVPGMHIVGVGQVELVEEDGSVAEELGPGDFLFASEVMSAGNAARTARAGESGALVLFADRMAAHELLVSVPPLLEILAS